MSAVRQEERGGGKGEGGLLGGFRTEGDSGFRSGDE